MSGFLQSTMYLCQKRYIWFSSQYLWNGLMKIPRYTVFLVYCLALVLFDQYHIARGWRSNISCTLIFILSQGSQTWKIGLDPWILLFKMHLPFWSYSRKFTLTLKSHKCFSTAWPADLSNDQGWILEDRTYYSAIVFTKTYSTQVCGLKEFTWQCMGGIKQGYLKHSLGYNRIWLHSFLSSSEIPVECSISSVSSHRQHNKVLIWCSSDIFDKPNATWYCSCT